MTAQFSKREFINVFILNETMLAGCHNTGINFLLTSFLHALRCLNLLSQAICDTIIGSFPSKLTS